MRKSLSGLLFVIFVLMFSEVSAQRAVLRTGNSGKTIKMINVQKVFFKDKSSALLLRYVTDQDIHNVDALRREAREIWTDFEPDVVGSKMTGAVLSATEPPPAGKKGEKSKTYNFIFIQDDKGLWTSTDKKLSEWLLLIQEKDAVKRLKGLEKWAADGDAQAGYMLGNAYLAGTGGVTQNSDEAIRRFKDAWKAGSPVGANNLGIMYLRGIGVPPDNAQAIQWFLKADQKGYALAEENLGDLYLQGRGVTQDPSKAALLYKLAAEKGSTNGITALGSLCLTGKGVKQDYGLAFKLLKMASYRGSPAARTNLSLMYSKGWGIKKDPEQAYKMAAAAAQAGFLPGEVVLGKCFEDGCGVKRSRAMALKYYELAAKGGSSDGKANMERLQKKMKK